MSQQANLNATHPGAGLILTKKQDGRFLCRLKSAVSAPGEIYELAWTDTVAKTVVSAKRYLFPSNVSQCTGRFT
jgi:hypothetical protein